MDFDFCLHVLYASVGCSIAFQDEKRVKILKIRQDYVKNARYFGRSFLISGGKSPSGNEEWYDHAFKTGAGNRWKSEFVQPEIEDSSLPEIPSSVRSKRIYISKKKFTVKRMRCL